MRATFLFGRGRRTRTHDTQFWRLVFYQLNYTPKQQIYDTTFRRICQGVFKKNSAEQRKFSK